MSPEEFWRLSPAEMATLAEARLGAPGPAPFGAVDLAQLMARFPD